MGKNRTRMNLSLSHNTFFNKRKSRGNLNKIAKNFKSTRNDEHDTC